MSDEISSQRLLELAQLRVENERVKELLRKESLAAKTLINILSSASEIYDNENKALRALLAQARETCALMEEGEGDEVSVYQQMAASVRIAIDKSELLKEGK